MTPSIQAASATYTVYFYNPESNINNFVALKDGFDAYLSTLGAFEFQPFSDKTDFEKALQSGMRGVVLVSSWHYRSLRRQFPLEPLLHGVFQDAGTQRHILCGHAGQATSSDIAGATIATAGSPTYSRTILRQMLPEATATATASVTFMAVPKDLDALLAIGFGVVDFAIATENTFHRLAEINPAEYELLRKLAQSDEALLPVVASSTPTDSNVMKLVEHFVKMPLKSDGEQTLNMINLDKLRRITDHERRLLKP